MSKLRSFFTSLLPQTPTSLSRQFLSNVLFLCLKGIKAACFGHFFESHISMSSYTHKIVVGFFSCSSVLCQFNQHASQRTKKGKGEKFYSSFSIETGSDSGPVSWQGAGCHMKQIGQLSLFLQQGLVQIKKDFRDWGLVVGRGGFSKKKYYIKSVLRSSTLTMLGKFVAEEGMCPGRGVNSFKKCKVIVSDCVVWFQVTLSRLRVFRASSSTTSCLPESRYNCQQEGRFPKHVAGTVSSPTP